MRDNFFKTEQVYDVHEEMRKRIKKQFEDQYDILMKPEIHEPDCLVLDCPTGCFKRVPDKVVSESYEVRMQEKFEIAGEEETDLPVTICKKKPRYTAEQIQILTEMMRANRPIKEIEDKRKYFEELNAID